MRQAFAPVGTRLRKAAATEDGGESVCGPGEAAQAVGPEFRVRGSHPAGGDSQAAALK